MRLTAHFVPAQGVAGVDADADDVAGVDGEVEDLEGFVFEDRLATVSGVAPAST